MASLLNIEEKYGESFRDFLKHFNEVRFRIENCSFDIVVIDLVCDVRHAHLKFSIGKRKPVSLNKLLEHIDKYIA